MRTYHFQITIVIFSLFFLITQSAENETENPVDHVSGETLLKQWNKLIRRIRNPRLNASNSIRRQKMSSISYSLRRPGPTKRDFQDHNPPRSPEELYRRYDPSVALSTGVVLGGILGVIVGRVFFRFAVRMTKKQLRKTKRFAKYFPESELPPLHIAQQFAREQGVALPESLISKLVRSGSDGNLKGIADAVKSPAAVTTAVVSPLILQQQRVRGGPSLHSPSTNELLGLIRLNVIGATPSISPVSGNRFLPTLIPVENRVQNQRHIALSPTASPQSISYNFYQGNTYQNLRNANFENANSENANFENALENCPVVTTAAVENQPLLFSTTTSAANLGNHGTATTSSQKRNSIISFTPGASTIDSRPMSGHGSTGVRPLSTSSKCLSNGETVANQNQRAEM